ncbi:MAG: HlyC/CorC family transporter [Chloroflexi bacterium]|nr:HlyC/CorC family transporter [Chloroflexota bacterium]
MSPGNAAEILILIAGLAILGISSGATTALTGIRRARLWHLFSTDREAGLEFEAQIGQYRSSLVVVRMVALVAAISSAILLAHEISDGLWWAILIAALAVSILQFFVEGQVRLIAAKDPERYFHGIAIPLAVLRKITRPVTRLTPLSSEAAFSHSLEDGDEVEKPLEEVREMQEIVSSPDRPAVPDEAEQEMIGAVMELKDTSVREVMTPRPDMEAVGDDESFDDVIKLMTERGRKRVPVYHESLDNIVGIIHYGDVLKAAHTGQKPAIKDLAKPVLFVPEFKKARDLLRDFLVKRVHMAVVVDEYGGVEGLVTLTDLVQEIVGDIAPEADSEVSMVKDGEAVFDGQVSIYEVNDNLETSLKGENYGTIGGFVLHHLGRLAKPGDRVHAEGVQVEVVSTAGRRIRKVRVKRLAPVPEQPPAA